MKYSTTPRRSALRHLALPLFVAFGVSMAAAIDYEWDTGPAGSPAVGSGTWNTSTSNWTTDSGATKSTFASSSSNNVTFAGADGSEDEYVISLANNYSVRSLNVASNGYVFQSADTNLRTISGASSTTSFTVATGKSVTLGNNFRFSVNGNTSLDGGGTVVLSSGSQYNVSASIQTQGDTSVVINGGTFTAAHFNVSTAHATINSGSLTVSSSDGVRFRSGSEVNSVDLNGGTLTTTRIWGGGTVSFNGGTLKPYNTSFASNFMSGANYYIEEGGLIYDSNNLDITVATAIQHGGTAPTDGGLTKTGSGKLTLSGTSTYTGVTTINAGTLAVNGALSSSDVTIGGGTLGGTGDITGSVTVASGGTLAPGNSTGTLTVGDATFESGGSFTFEINDATGTAGSTTAGWDLLNADSLTITAGTGEFTIALASLDAVQDPGLAQNFDEASDYAWLFVDTDATIGSFASDLFVLDASGFQNVFGGSFDVARGDFVGGDNSQLYITYTAVPEPSTLTFLFALGLGYIVYLRRKQ